MTTHGIYNKGNDGTEKYLAYYRCVNSSSCDFGNVSHKKMEIAFQEYMGELPSLKPTDDMQIEQQQELHQKQIELVQIYSDKLNQLSNRENEALSLYVDGHIEFGEYRDIKDKVKKGKLEINQK